jgi:hypothetical protein
MGSEVFAICDEPDLQRDEQGAGPDNIHVGGADAACKTRVA